MIIDPKVPRPPAREMVMLMNGYNLKDDYSTNASATEQQPPTASALRTNFEKATASDEGSGPGNQIYSVNGPAFIYNDYPIQLATGQQYRIYLVNMLEFDPMNNFHLHGNMFEYYPAGTGLNPTYKTDIVELAQGDRGIVEFNYTKPGMYMFHAHTTEFTNLGWMGMFNVVNHPDTMTQSVATISSTPVKSHQTIKLHHNQDSPMNINRPPFVPGI
jgi:FtsP/CotA-like multicopper oxidase with cupredoxin domain